MLKQLLSFGLSRRPIILLGLIVFIGGGLIAFSKLNIEAYPNPAPVILEITAQAPSYSQRQDALEQVVTSLADDACCVRRGATGSAHL